MKKKQRNLVAYLFLTVLVSILLFTLLKVSLLEDELKQIKETKAELELALETQEELQPIDLMLVDSEDYGGALEAYQSKFQNKEVENEQLEWRLALTEKLVHLKENELAVPLYAEKSEVEVSLVEAASDAVLKREDSLQFVLEKTKIELTRTRKQLQKKSFGQYLTFATQKGNPLHYVGAVKHGKANGFGIALLNSGSRYKGEWKDNQRHGSGTFYWSDGQYYEGSYTNDKRNGEGTYYWPNGEKYVGHWKNDERCGEGVFYDKAGKPMAQGIWKNDKLVTQTKRAKKETETIVTVSL